MTVTLVLSELLADELTDAASGSVESGGVLLAHYVKTPTGNVRLLGHQMRWVPDHAYRRRRSTELVVASEGFVPALAAAEEHGSVPIWVHTHPGPDSSLPQASGTALSTAPSRISSGCAREARGTERSSWAGQEWVSTSPDTSSLGPAGQRLTTCGLPVQGARCVSTGYTIQRR